MNKELNFKYVNSQKVGPKRCECSIVVSSDRLAACFQCARLFIARGFRQWNAAPERQSMAVHSSDAQKVVVTSVRGRSLFGLCPSRAPRVVADETTADTHLIVPFGTEEDKHNAILVRAP